MQWTPDGKSLLVGRREVPSKIFRLTWQPDSASCSDLFLLRIPPACFPMRLRSFLATSKVTCILTSASLRTCTSLTD